MIVSEEPSDHQSMEEEEREEGGPGGGLSKSGLACASLTCMCA